MEMSKYEYVWKMVPFAAMVMLECFDVGLTTLSKAAMSRGMSHFVFVVYSNALATLILFPSSFIFHRTKRPPLTRSLLCRFFILGFLGITLMQNCVFTGVNYSSPTLGSAIGNLIPALTFILAVIFRMEKVDLKSLSGQVKIMGTITSIIGALVVTLYKGPPIGWIQSTPSVPSLSILTASHEHSHLSSLITSNWIIGGIFLTIASVSASIWNTLQAATVKGYPSEMTIVSFNCFFGTIQCAVLSLIAERDVNAWTLRPDIELTSIIYSAVFGSVITPSVITWCIYKKGPVFVAMFKPLGIAIAAIMGVIFLGDTLHLGSVFGAIIIAIGFYSVIWAQSKEEKADSDDEDIDVVHGLGSSEHKLPLLRNYIEASNSGGGWFNHSEYKVPLKFPK